MGRRWGQERDRPATKRGCQNPCCPSQVFSSCTSQDWGWSIKSFNHKHFSIILCHLQEFVTIGFDFVLFIFYRVTKKGDSKRKFNCQTNHNEPKKFAQLPHLIRMNWQVLNWLFGVAILPLLSRWLWGLTMDCVKLCWRSWSFKAGSIA